MTSGQMKKKAIGDNKRKPRKFIVDVPILEGRSGPDGLEVEFI